MINESERVQIIKSSYLLADKLYWISSNCPPKNIKKAFYFSIDNQLIYDPFFADFGPLNINQVYKFTIQLSKILSKQDLANDTIYHYTSLDQAKRANAALLMGSFMIIVQGLSAEQAFKKFEHVNPPFVEFRDALTGPCSYKCSVNIPNQVKHCLGGLQYAIRLGWFDIKTFNHKEYQYFQKHENGDMTWIIPEKFIAMSDPHSNEFQSQNIKTLKPLDYIPIFSKLKITTIIRLNNKTYSSQLFTKYGFKHFDLFFQDGTIPPKVSLLQQSILMQFMKICQNQPGAIAVHCKAGLGRTGVLIGCFALKHYHFRPQYFIGWIRLVRPGSILGPQQHFLLRQLFSEESMIWKRIRPFLQKYVCTEKRQESKQNACSSINQINNGQRKMGIKDKVSV